MLARTCYRGREQIGNRDHSLTRNRNHRRPNPSRPDSEKTASSAEALR